MPDNQSPLIFPGKSVGFYTPDPELFGELTVIRRQGYKWVCKAENGATVFIQFRDFALLGNSDERTEE